MEDQMERLPDNGNIDITDADWCVNMMEADGETGFRVTVRALNEQGAIISAEEKFGEDGCYAISAYLKPVVTRVAYWAGKQRQDGTFEPHPSDHVDWRMPDGSLVSGYRFEHARDD
jgi:hypothetical protein